MPTESVREAYNARLQVATEFNRLCADINEKIAPVIRAWLMEAFTDDPQPRMRGSLIDPLTNAKFYAFEDLAKDRIRLSTPNPLIEDIVIAAELDLTEGDAFLTAIVPNQPKSRVIIGQATDGVALFRESNGGAHGFSIMKHLAAFENLVFNIASDSRRLL